MHHCFRFRDIPVTTFFICVDCGLQIIVRFDIHLLKSQISYSFFNQPIILYLRPVSCTTSARYSCSFCSSAKLFKTVAIIEKNIRHMFSQIGIVKTAEMTESLILLGCTRYVHCMRTRADTDKLSQRCLMLRCSYPDLHTLLLNTLYCCGNCERNQKLCSVIKNMIGDNINRSVFSFPKIRTGKDQV